MIESPAIYLNLSAFDNLKTRALLHDIPDERIYEVLQLVGLSDTGKKKAGHFSLGMKQRLGLGMAIITNPDLLILDEPTNGLDPDGIKELLAWLYVDREYSRHGIGTALVNVVLKKMHEPISIEVLNGNTPALNFYQKFGFEIVKTESGQMPGNEEFSVTVHILKKYSSNV